MQSIRSRVFDILLAVWTGVFGVGIPVLKLSYASDRTIRRATRLWARGVFLGLRLVVGLD